MAKSHHLKNPSLWKFLNLLKSIQNLKSSQVPQKVPMGSHIVTLLYVLSVALVDGGLFQLIQETCGVFTISI